LEERRWDRNPGRSKNRRGQIVKEIRGATRRQFSAEEKILIVLSGLRGEDSIADLCRREGIVRRWPANRRSTGWS
jgi:transposase